MKNYYLKNVVTLQFDEKRCMGCGMCVTVCPRGVFQMNGKKAMLVDRDACMECGACEKNCPFSAISVNAGVGCAYAVIKGALTGNEPNCCCSSSGEGKNTCC
ncbi:MAG: mercury methylation ferredoxin HgcB [Syntrophorhabdaceae bacterium]|nr:mercury methylation ferredoxin HgcB [Syntrophorhabdaceae bacterium]